MLRVVFDTVVYVRSLINPKSYSGRIIFQYYTDYQLFVSREVVIEILEVLARDEIKSKFKSIRGMNIRRVLEIIGEAKVVQLKKIPGISRDLKDDKFLATAKEGKCNYLVTEDEDLLVLKKYKGIKIINTTTFLKILSKD